MDFLFVRHHQNTWVDENRSGNQSCPQKSESWEIFWKVRNVNVCSSKSKRAFHDYSGTYMRMNLGVVHFDRTDHSIRKRRNRTKIHAIIFSLIHFSWLSLVWVILYANFYSHLHTLVTKPHPLNWHHWKWIWDFVPTFTWIIEPSEWNLKSLNQHIWNIIELSLPHSNRRTFHWTTKQRKHQYKKWINLPRKYHSCFLSWTMFMEHWTISKLLQLRCVSAILYNRIWIWCSQNVSSTV